MAHRAQARASLAMMSTPMTREKLVDLADRLDCIEPKNIGEADTLNEAAEVIRSVSDHPPRLRVAALSDMTKDRT
jgi:hypothetical protein